MKAIFKNESMLDHVRYIYCYEEDITSINLERTFSPFKYSLQTLDDDYTFLINTLKSLKLELVYLEEGTGLYAQCYIYEIIR